MGRIRLNKYNTALFFILAAAGFLSFFSVWNEGYANTYYSAAVKSMLTSFHNFFFVSFDSAGYVSVDKPALGLWIQALFALIFGVHGWSLVLPQAIASVISVAVLYQLVQRTFGKPAGLISALALALTPIFIAVSRTNNLDTTLVMLLLLGAWALTAAAEKGGFKLLLLSMALIGLGFNVKMLQAFMVLPAFYLVYLFATSLKLGKKILQLSGATIVLLVVSLSWAAIVDLTPADKRPYVGSSKTNSVLELALGYNGIQRVVGNGPMGGRTPDAGRRNGNMDNMPDDGGNNLPAGFSLPNGMNLSSGGQMPVGMIGPGGEGGNKGVFRLLNKQMAGQISWLLPIAFTGLFAAFLRAGKKGIAVSKSKRQSLLLWVMWILPMIIYFSIAAFFHRYYLSILAPGIAALVGIGAVELWKLYTEKLGWKAYILPASLITNALFQGFLLSRYPEWNGWLTPIICILSSISALALVIIKIIRKEYEGNIVKAASAAGFTALLLAPALWAATPIVYGTEATLPYAGPELADKRLGPNGAAGQMAGVNSPMENMHMPKLTEFLVKNKKNEKYLVAVPSATTASSIILETGEAVMAVGGFIGSDNILTVDRLDKMVQNGEIRYFMVMDLPGGGGMGGMMGASGEISDWVKANGTPVPEEQWMEGGGFRGMGRMGGMKLYDLGSKDKDTVENSAGDSQEAGNSENNSTNQGNSFEQNGGTMSGPGVAAAPSDMGIPEDISVEGTVNELETEDTANMPMKPYQLDTGKEKYVLISMEGLDFGKYVGKQVQVNGKLMQGMPAAQGTGSDKVIMVVEVR